MENPTGYIVFGPKETIRYSACVQVFYTPTESQIRNMKEMFGWEERTAERRKKQFENHVRLFAKHYHNGYEYKEGEQA